MKKRLSLLLATLMVISLLPVSAFAAPNKIHYRTPDVTSDDTSKEVVVSFEYLKSTALTHQAPLNAVVELTGGAKFAKDGGGAYEPFTLTWDNVAATPANATIIDDTTASITQNAALAIQAGGKSEFTFTFKVNYKDASPGNVFLNITDRTTVGDKQDSIGSHTDKIAIATVKPGDVSDLAITAKDPNKTMSYDGGELSQFEIKNFKNVKAGHNLFIYSDTTGVSFKDSNDNVVIIDGKALTYVSGGTAAANQFAVSNGTLVLNTTDFTNASKYVIVKPAFDVSRKASEGDVSIVAETRSAIGASYDLSASGVVGKIVDYNVTVKVVEVGKKEIPSVWGGEEAKVRVTLTGPKGSISNRPIDFKVEGADVVYKPVNSAAGAFNTNGIPKPFAVKSSFVNGPQGDPSAKDYAKDGPTKGYPDTTFADGEFSITGGVAGSGNEFSVKDEVYFEMVIKTAHDKDGIGTITATQRGWEAKADLVKVTPKFTVKTEEMPVKKGEARAVSNIVVTEAKPGLLKKGETITLKFETRRHYTQFSGKAVKVEATNGMKFDEADWTLTGADDKYTMLSLPIKKASKGEAAQITISDIKVLVDGSATDDVIPVAVGLNGNKVAKPNYIKVVKEYALESIKTVFTIGQTQYDVNGQAKASAAAPYIKNGKTMLPIRALAESLGLTVQWNGATKTATFSDATKVAAVTIGAEKMFVNGTPVPLAAKAELVSGTTFVELRSLATAFGVQIDWDAAAKTATVSK